MYTHDVKYDSAHVVDALLHNTYGYDIEAYKRHLRVVGKRLHRRKHGWQPTLVATECVNAAHQLWDLRDDKLDMPVGDKDFYTDQAWAQGTSMADIRDMHRNWTPLNRLQWIDEAAEQAKHWHRQKMAYMYEDLPF
jgi:hypothetical protein